MANMKLYQLYFTLDMVSSSGILLLCLAVAINMNMFVDACGQIHPYRGTLIESICVIESVQVSFNLDIKCSCVFQDIYRSIFVF